MGEKTKKKLGGKKKSFSFHTVVQLLQTLKNKVFFNKEKISSKFWLENKSHSSYLLGHNSTFTTVTPNQDGIDFKKEKENQKFYLEGSQKLWFYFYGDSRWCLMKCCSCLDFYKFLPELIWNRKYRILVNVPKVPQMIKMLNS